MGLNLHDEAIKGWQWDPYLNETCKQNLWKEATPETRLYYLAMATLPQSRLLEDIKWNFNGKLGATLEVNSHRFLCWLNVQYKPNASLSKIVQKVTLSMWEMPSADQQLTPITPIWVTWPEPDASDLPDATNLLRGELPTGRTEDVLGRLILNIGRWLRENPHNDHQPSFAASNTRTTLVQLIALLDQYPKASEGEVRRLKGLLQERLGQLPPDSTITLDDHTAGWVHGTVRANGRVDFSELDALVRELDERGPPTDPSGRVVSTGNLTAMLAELLREAEKADPVPEPEPVSLPDQADSVPPQEQPDTPPARSLLMPAILVVALLAIGSLALWKARPLQKL